MKGVDFSPDITSEVIIADGPGIISISILFSIASFTINSPGLEIQGVPASETRPTLFPNFNISIISFLTFFSFYEWYDINLTFFSLPEWYDINFFFILYLFNSFKVTLVSSRAT